MSNKKEKFWFRVVVKISLLGALAVPVWWAYYSVISPKFGLPELSYLDVCALLLSLQAIKDVVSD